MNSIEFVAELESLNSEYFAGMSSAEDEASVTDVLTMIRIAMKNELEATELAAVWLPSTPELDVKLGLARQVGDESKHYLLLAKRYRELGGDPESFDPLQGGFSPLFDYLKGLPTSVERVAAGQFTREALAQKRNDMFLDFLRRTGDEGTARLYSDTIQPDEEYHHEFGRRMLLKYATAPQLQNAAREASRRTLEIAGRLRDAAIQKTGKYQIPGC
jgi:1,2-phenylacetyl-CoA epoxidase catalytic subunit